MMERVANSIYNFFSVPKPVYNGPYQNCNCVNSDHRSRCSNRNQKPLFISLLEAMGKDKKKQKPSHYYISKNTVYFNNYLILLSTYLQFGLDMKQHPLKLFLFRIISMENTSECIDEKIDGSWKRKMINGNAMGPCKRDFSCIFAYEINSRPTIYGVPLRSLPNLHPHTNQNLVHSTKEKIYIKKINVSKQVMVNSKWKNIVIVLNND